MNMMQLVSQLVIGQAAATESAEPGGWMSSLMWLPYVLMFAVVYFLMIRPANKQRREHQDLLTSLKKDDEVVTSGGVYGKVISLDDKIVTLEIADKVKIRILRDRIAGRWAPTTGDSARK
jgi:preprotein translocase subunit YajC